MHGLAPAPRQGVFWWAVAWNHMEWVCCKTTGVFLLPQLFWHLYVHVSESKPSVSLQNFDQLFDVPSHLWPIHNDLLAQQCPLQITSMTIGVMRFGELDAVHFSVCWPLWYHCLAWLRSKMLFDQIQIIMARVETQNWYLKTLMADAFLLLIQRKFEIFWDVSPHFFSDCQGLLF